MKESTDPSISQAVVRVLRDMGLTNTRIGQITAVKPSEMTRIVKGEREFKANQLLAIERWMSIPLCALLAKAMQFLDCRRAAGSAMLRYVEELTHEAERCIEVKRRQIAKDHLSPVLDQEAA